MNKTQKIVLSGLFTALAFIFTYFVRIPISTTGYFNVGDAFIILSAIVIDPFSGVLVGVLAGTLSDLLSGYAIFIPFTIIAKGLEALLAGLIYHRLKNKFRYIGILLGPLLMVAIYAISYLILFDLSLLIASVPFDLLQASIAIVLSYILIKVLEKTPFLKR